MNKTNIDKLEEQLNAMFRGSEGHPVVGLLCGILRDQEHMINYLNAQVNGR
jgi:hypothetical protein